MRPAQGLRVVERAGEHAAGLGQQPLRRLGLLEVGDVLDHVDRLRDAAVRRAQRTRLHARPARLAGRPDAVLDDHRLRLLPGQRAPSRQPLQRQGVAVLVEHVEARGELRRRGRQQARPVGEAERLPQQPHGGVVDVRQPAVVALDRDGVGHARQDRLQLVVRTLELAVEPRVLEVEPAAVGELLRARRGPPRRSGGPDPALTSARSPTTRPPARSGTIIDEWKPSARRSSSCSASWAAASSKASGISGCRSGTPDRITCGEPTGASGSSG